MDSGIIVLIAFGSVIYTAGVIIVCVRLCRREKQGQIISDRSINSNPLLGRCINDNSITDPTYSDIYRAKI